jgi:hypothetical protein
MCSKIRLQRWQGSGTDYLSGARICIRRDQPTFQKHEKHNIQSNNGVVKQSCRSVIRVALECPTFLSHLSWMLAHSRACLTRSRCLARGLEHKQGGSHNHADFGRIHNLASRCNIICLAIMEISVRCVVSSCAWYAKLAEATTTSHPIGKRGPSLCAYPAAVRWP